MNHPERTVDAGPAEVIEELARSGDVSVEIVGAPGRAAKIIEAAPQIETAPVAVAELDQADETEFDELAEVISLIDYLDDTAESDAEAPRSAESELVLLDGGADLDQPEPAAAEVDARLLPRLVAKARRLEQRAGKQAA